MMAGGTLRQESLADSILFVRFNEGGRDLFYQTYLAHRWCGVIRNWPPGIQESERELAMHAALGVLR
jgi:hypothetical protein